MPVPPTVLIFVADIMSAQRIESAAKRSGYQTLLIENEAELLVPAEDPGSDRAAEPLGGTAGALLEQVTLWQPALIIFDLGNTAVPWQRWLPLLKSVPATRRIPVICFGAHVQGDALKLAHSYGADAVRARSSFFNDLPDIIEQYARTPDYDAIEQACIQPLSALALRGLEEFNRGEYFEAHESLEEAWNAESSPGRELYRGILQVAVAYLQIERENFPGAMKIFLRSRQWLIPLPDVCRGVDVAALRRDASRVEQRLKELGPQRIAEFERSLFQPIHYSNTE